MGEKKILMNSCGWKVQCLPLLVMRIYLMQYFMQTVFYGQLAIVVKTLLYFHLNDVVPLCFLSFIRYSQLFNLDW